MDNNYIKYVYIGWAIMWVAVSAAILGAVYFTKNMNCLWFFIIPLLVGFPKYTRDLGGTNDESE